MLHYHSFFNLVVFICSQTAQSEDVVWFNPPAAGPTNQYASDLAWQVGSMQTLSCHTSYPTADIFLSQQHLDAVPQVIGLGTISTKGHLNNITLPWNVTLKGFDQQTNETLPFFYFTLSPRDASGNYQNGTSHYINITGNDAATNSSVSNSSVLGGGGPSGGGPSGGGSSGGGPSDGTIAAITLGVFGGLVCILFVIFACRRRVSRVLRDTEKRRGRSRPTGRRNISNIEERNNISNTGQSSVPSALRDTSPDTSVGPPNPRRAVREDIEEDGTERSRRVREPQYGLNTQRRGPPAAHTRLTSPHAYLASEADTEDFIQMARRNRGRGRGY